MDPQTTQYGSHMVMTNVKKPSKLKYINIDTRFRDEYNDQSNFIITLPEIITDVKSMKVKCIEIPMTFYNISSTLDNNYFHYTIHGKTTKVVIPDGNYNASGNDLNQVIHTLLQSTNLSYTRDSSGQYLFCSNEVNHVGEPFYPITIDFSPKNKYNFKSSLGWLVGYRNPVYILSNEEQHLYPEYSNQYNNNTNSLPIFNKYMYLAIDEFNKGIQNSFITPLSTAMINKNIISRISLMPQNYGNIIIANLHNGLLVSDNRSYNGKVDLKRLSIQLINENGMPIDLNGYDFSFCLEVEYE